MIFSPVRRSGVQKCPGRPAGRLWWIRETCLTTVCYIGCSSNLSTFLFTGHYKKKKIHTEDQSWLTLSRHLQFWFVCHFQGPVSSIFRSLPACLPARFVMARKPNSFSRIVRVYTFCHVFMGRMFSSKSNENLWEWPQVFVERWEEENGQRDSEKEIVLRRIKKLHKHTQMVKHITHIQHMSAVWLWCGLP